MTRWVVVVTAPAGATRTQIDGLADQLTALADADAGVVASQAGRHGSGSVGPGSMTWDVTLAGDLSPLELPRVAELLATEAIVEADPVALRPVRSRFVEAGGERSKRTLLLRVRPDTPAETVHRFEQQLMAMPDFIDSIGSWALSRVAPGRSATSWTHVWEQEFASPAGLHIGYMSHPYHWSRIDAWFDAENPESIVDPQLAHLYYETTGPVLTE